MSVRAVAVHDPSRGRRRVVPRRVTPPTVVDRRLWWVNSPKAALRQRFNNDRRLIRLKFMMLGAIGLLAALLEVP